MFRKVNTLFMEAKLDFAIPIRLLTSFSHLAYGENKLPKKINDCTCSRGRRYGILE